ncbi:MAG: mitochondrial fission ELM1 family protein, partial [Candidatus Omnitrophica bacterium]|nr:mitochondrial fission ELM1 family protein [Candidatus Omnitrophota bacterium]
MAERLAVGFVRILSAFLQALPLKAALGLGGVVGFIFSYVSHRRQIAYVNLKAAFGKSFSASERKRIIQKHFIHLAQNVVEILRFPKMKQNYIDQYITVEHRERYEQLAQKNEGTVLITPHFGNWELSQILSALVGKPMYVLAREQKHSRLNDFLNELRTSHGSVTIQKGEGVRDLIRELEKGGMVGALGDLSGGRSGLIIRFFGRKTTAPSGIFEIAKRTHSAILPCFVVRLKGPHHQVFIEEEFAPAEAETEEEVIHKTVQNYYRLLEKWITQYPDQWLWIYKRWKYCLTKRILILRDDRAGHTHQAEAIAQEFKKLKDLLGAEYEFEVQSIEIKFKSHWHRRLFFILAFPFYPFAQARLNFLNLFLEPACAQALQDVHADIIISAGSSLAPLNLLLKRENLAKSVGIMKPSFPYLSFFDLLIVPAHDALPRHVPHAIRTLVTPSRMDDALLDASGEHLKRSVPLEPNGVKRMSVFIGGKTKSYRFDRVEFRQWLKALKSLSEESNFELLVTTSRRTDPEISALVREELSGRPYTKLLVIANESNIENVAYGMLALSEIALVTEDSISMVSEAVSAGKNVLVMQLGNGKLPKKHSQFHSVLESN